MKYTGGCHCGEVRYEAEAELGAVVACNCSICSKKAHLMTFVPEQNFKLLSGEKSLGDYQFGPKKLHHMFCKNCGINVFGKGTDKAGQAMRALNVRCFDGVDVSKLQVHHYDGASI